MKEKKFLKSFGEIDEKIIQEATPKKYKTEGTKQGGSENWRKWIPAVACAYLLISSVGFAIWFNQSQRTAEPNSEQVLQQTEPGTFQELETDVAAEGTAENAGNDTEQDKLITENAEGIPETGQDETATETEYLGEEYTRDPVSEEIENIGVGNYFIYNGKGKYTIYKEETEPLLYVGKLITTVRRYLELNQLSNISCVSAGSSYQGDETTTEGDVLTHKPRTQYYRVDLVGREFSAEHAVGLINTLSRSMVKPGNCFVKINLCGKPLQLSEPMQEDGYSYMLVEIEDTESEPSAENGEEMVDVSFIITDRYGDPVSNIAYHIDYVSGEKGSYQPGYGITDSTGRFTRKLHPNATYTIYLEKQNAVSYTYEITPIVYERLSPTFEVTESCTKKFVWDNPSLVNRSKNPVTITVPETVDGSYKDLFIQLFTKSGGQIQLGYAESDGTFVWNDATDGNYHLNIQKFNQESEFDEIIYSKSYSVSIKDGKMTILAEEVEPITIPE